jgi:hypothetical protein
MYAKFSIQFQDKRNAKKPMRETVFDEFTALYEFVKSFDERVSDEAIGVHLPWHASDAQRQQISNLGYSLN